MTSRHEPDHPDADQRLEAFWESADDADVDAATTELEALLAELDLMPARRSFERASLRDFVGDERGAIGMYQAALTEGLDAPYRSQAIIQLASSLRNVGEYSAAATLLGAIADDDPLYPSARAFLALTQHDSGETTRAVRTALESLAPTLPAYSRSVRAYADDLHAAPHIRAIAVGLIVRGGHAFVEVYPATAERGAFARAIGGGILVGETAATAVVREFQEEVGVVVTDARLLSVTENIFDDLGRRGHEVAFVYAIGSPALESAGVSMQHLIEESGSTARWVPLDDLDTPTLPFYPPGVKALAADLSRG